MSDTTAYVKMLARFPFALQRLFSQRLTLPQAQAIIRQRLAQRADNFLAIAERCIYNYPSSPYLPLLKQAGCEPGDLRALVQQHGLEGALTVLRNQGVYFTFEEFKGRVPVVRGSTTLSIKARAFDNPFLRGELASQSGGSTGAPTQVTQDMEHLAARAPQSMVTLAAYQLLDSPRMIWRGILPDAGTLEMLMRHAYFGGSTERWFSNIGLSESKHWMKYGLATYYMIFWLKLFRLPIPYPEYVSTDRADVIVKNLVAFREQYGKVYLSTQVSRAVRVALAAEKAGISLHDITISSGGEPATPAKIAVIQRSGARFFANYSMREAGTLGYSCINAADPGDIHFYSDAHALITHPHPISDDRSVNAFHLTSLLPTAPKILLNLQLDDYGDVSFENCGCALYAYGFTTHLKNIRSYRKLTGEGVTLVGSDLIEIIDQVLPARFGGTPLDYQFQELEDPDGFTRLYLVIHPRLEIDEADQVIQTVLQALRSSPAGDAVRTVWQQTGTVRIKRGEPIWTTNGKLLPLHLLHKSS